ncbi:BQ5605_C008g05070 [Microbotryum silenes-dioicae]|uniref:BQ5605_C008g05070 protein n=1 Tax=Microbotryum silenes-dioicae TaxID=796604 RepID=A0A2X0MG77_9BASI|nr:BQ5605_C008g05070 [Microbotryum silenes-dioicae]
MRKWKIWRKGWGRAHNDEKGLKKGCDSVYRTQDRQLCSFFCAIRRERKGRGMKRNWRGGTCALEIYALSGFF